MRLRASLHRVFSALICSLKERCESHHSPRNFVDSSTGRSVSLIQIVGGLWTLYRGTVKCTTLHLWAANLNPFLVAHSCMAFTACCRCLSTVSRERPRKQIARSSTKSAVKKSVAIRHGSSLIFSPKHVTARTPPVGTPSYLLAVASAEGLATELEPLCISVCEALVALETAWLWVSPTGFALWALPTEVVFWTPPVVLGGSAEFWTAVLGLWVLPTGVEVIVWAPSLEAPWWASSTLDFSRLLSLFPKPSSLCCRDALSWRSLLMTSLNLAFSSLRGDCDWSSQLGWWPRYMHTKCAAQVLKHEQALCWLW